ncbi:MAG: hypothetical protein RL199_1253 [Pseudomonadota bacterium]|jgi:NADPH-dependent 2,4-dienoyl-CoA reductase/sulfur reductase-like enzyme
MSHFRYLIVGGGLAGDAALQALRASDPGGSIGVVGAEPHLPYDRSPLTKALWHGAPEGTVFRAGSRGGVELMLGRRAVALDTALRVVTDDRGVRHGYEKLLLATGAVPRRLVGAAPEVVWLRTLEDYRRLRGLAVEAARVAVLGGGFVGSEVAAALTTRGLHVTMLVAEDGLLPGLLPAELSQAITRDYRWRGVRVETGQRVTGVERRGRDLVVSCASGLQVAADVVVGGLGVIPETGLAGQAGLEVDDGIVVDDRLRTRVPDVFAAGDAARFPDGPDGRMVRVGHEEAALAMGLCAGRNMAGADLPFRHVPGFRLDLFGLDGEAVGEVDARLEVWPDWREPHRRGAVYYARNGRVTGVLCWGLPGRAEAARRIVARGELLRPETLRGRLTGS